MAVYSTILNKKSGRKVQRLEGSWLWKKTIAMSFRLHREGQTTYGNMGKMAYQNIG